MVALLDSMVPTLGGRRVRLCKGFSLSGTASVPVRAVVARHGSQVWLPLPLIEAARRAARLVECIRQPLLATGSEHAFQPILDYLHLRYHCGWTLEAVARFMGMSRRSMSRGVGQLAERLVWAFVLTDCENR